MFESLSTLDYVRLNFSPESLMSLNIGITFIMFGVALEIKAEHFKELIHRPKSVFTGIVSQFMALPVLTFLFIISFGSNLTPSVALGLILVASCPGGNISNFMSNYGKGNTALSVALTSFATIVGIVMTPFNFALWGGLYIKFLEYQQGGELLRPLVIDEFEVFKTVLIIFAMPLVAGITFAHYFPKITKKIVGTFKTVSILIFVVIVTVAINNNLEHFSAQLQYIVILVLIHNSLAFFTGYSLSSLAKIPSKDRRSVTIETGIQNSGLALILIFNPDIFPEDLPTGGMAVMTAAWGIWHMVAGTLLAFYWSKKPLKEEEVDIKELVA